MEWTTDILTKRAKRYNSIYFNNEIKLPIVIKWSRHMFNNDSRANAYCKSTDNEHIIMFNVKYQSVSEEMMRSTLVHEMIHAWQDEHDDKMYDEWSTYAGHGPAFMQKCEELNAKFKFTYPLMRYTSGNKLTQLHKQDKGLYYVYKMSFYTEDDGTKVEYPIGVFTKFLYNNEVRHLRRNGLQLKYYKQPKFNDSVTYITYRNKYIDECDCNVTYSALKNATAIDFTQYMCDNGYKQRLFVDDDFNFADGIEVN